MEFPFAGCFPAQVVTWSRDKGYRERRKPPGSSVAIFADRMSLSHDIAYCSLAAALCCHYGQDLSERFDGCPMGVD